jgi:membrane protein DedA with SNARE-associated domain
MNLGTFLLWSAFGSAIWTALLAALGYVLSHNYAKVEKFLGPVSTILVCGVLALYVWRVIRQASRA